SAITGDPLFTELRVDGAVIVERYRESEPDYDTSAVWVLDRAVNVIGRDGSRTELVHSVVHLKTDEALEEHGELSLPSNALLLTGRTIKQSGRVLEPEDIANKPSISFPDLQPGDFIEIEYAVFHPSSPLFAGGFDTGRFYFQDFDTAFHRSEILVVAPAAMPIEADPRGSCPEPTEKRLGDLQSLTWRTRGLLPHVLEPLAPVAREYLPSIRVTSAASWTSLTSRIGDMLGDLGRPSAQLLETAKEALIGIPAEDHTARRRALYHWVIEHVEETGDLFDQASHVAVRKTGSRIRLFVALLEAADYSGRLAMVRETAEDNTESQVPSLAMLDRLVVDVEGDGWVSLEQDGAPYGYLPPDLRNRLTRYIDDGETTETDGGTVQSDVQHVKVAITLRADGSARGEVTEELTGILAAGWRTEFRAIPGVEIDKSFEELYLGTAIAGATLVSLRIEGLEDPEASLLIVYEIEVPQFASREDRTLGVVVPFPVTLLKRTGGLPVRSTPAVLASHIEKTVEATVELPPGYSARVREPGGSVKTEWGEARRKISTKGGKVHAEYQALLEADRIDPDDYLEFVAFARELDRLTKLGFEAVSGTDAR
ncbi:MAG: DUF3857 domain-containing protein, partial [Deltaproteobacteria bacterium]|nr:DUF3857 domain-containing protein [Deltaproteobacteria bacterium]